ncbi:IclR family transcriptional regulator [Alcaligenaceae bacterium]|nr:IclR family transcriptional regulator [Alcaligenaceae bacterium]
MSSASIQPAGSSSGPQSVGRVISIIERLASQPDGATLTELATFIDAPKTSLVGLLNAMIRENCLRRETNGRYVLGERLYALIAHPAFRQDISTLALPLLRELVTVTGETAVLGIVADDADRVVYIERVESDHPVRYTVKVGERREMHCTATGKVLLAYSAPDRLKRVLQARALKRFTETTIVSPGELRAELLAVRQEGIARTHEERVAGASGVASPVFDANGEAVAAILVAGPSERIRARKHLIERHVLATARKLSLLLGGSYPHEPAGPAQPAE